MRIALVVGTPFLLLVIGGCLSPTNIDRFEKVIDEIDKELALRTTPPPPQSSGGTMTVEEASQIAVESNPQLLAKIANVKAESYKVLSESSLNDPQVSVGINGVPISKPLATGDRMKEMYGATQELQMFGKLNAKAERETHASRAELEMFRDTVNEIRMKTKSAYYEYAEHYYKHKLHEEHRELWNYVLRVVEVKYKTGQAPYSDLVMAQTTVGEVEQEINDHHRRLLTSWARLNTLMNRSAGEKMTEPKLADPRAVGEAFDELLARALRENPELKASSSSIQKEEAGLNLAQKDYLFPDVMAGWTYERDIEGTDGWNGMLSVNLPWIFSKRRAEVKMQESKVFASKADLESKKREIEFALKAAMERATAARKNALIYKESIIPVTEQNISVAEKLYRTGKIDFGTYSTYLSNLIMAKEKYYELVAEHGMAVAEIEKLTGGVK